MLALPPHGTLSHYYAAEAERPRVVREIFDAGAPSYELVCRLMSFGTGASYRAEALRTAGLGAGMRVLDVAAGTGLMLRAAEQIVGPAGTVVGLDPSGGMLAECRKGSATPLVRGYGEHLPFEGASFNMVSMGYALRHVADLRLLFAEFARVLQPGGRVIIVELTQPQSTVARWFTRLYLKTLVPALANVTARDLAAGRMMHYFWDTIEQCVPPSEILSALRQAGFSDVLRRVSGGILSEYSGTRVR